MSSRHAVVAVLGLLVIASGSLAGLLRALAELFIAFAVLLAVAAAAVAALLTWRDRRGGLPFIPPAVTRMGMEPPRELPAREFHLHLHGVDAEQVAEMLRQQERR